MDHHLTHIQPDPPPADTPADTGWHRVMLRELAQMAMDATCLAHIALLKQAQEPETPQPERAAATLAFTRLSGIVRQVIALDARLASADHEAATGAAAERTRHARTDARRRAHRHANLRHRMTEAIRDAANCSDTDALLADLDDRLDDADIQAALETTPATRIIATLCAEWGITPNYARWTDAELEALDEPDPPLRPT